jgi:N-acetylmuramoyl-L-alanine amidase
MRIVEKIVIHCSASPNGRKTIIEDIDRWHVDRGFRRSSVYREKIRPHLNGVGYHWVITLDGTARPGRDEQEIGAHAVGHNAKSIGICLVGTDKFTEKQWDTLKELILSVGARYPDADVVGHRDIPGVNKECPGFDVAAYQRMKFEIPPQHLLGGVEMQV